MHPSTTKAIAAAAAQITAANSLIAFSKAQGEALLLVKDDPVAVEQIAKDLINNTAALVTAVTTPGPGPASPAIGTAGAHWTTRALFDAAVAAYTGGRRVLVDDKEAKPAATGNSETALEYFTDPATGHVSDAKPMPAPAARRF